MTLKHMTVAMRIADTVTRTDDCSLRSPHRAWRVSRHCQYYILSIFEVTIILINER